MSKSFPKGGVHPQECKFGKDAPIVGSLLPDMVTVYLSQHIGAPAIACVEPGDKVKTGQLIAKASGFVSANIHSPISGEVKKIDSVADNTGLKKPAIIIQRQGDEWLEGIDTTPDINEDIIVSKEEIIAKITNAGIVGLGGATFPAHVKISIPTGKKCEVLVINGAECEPYLTCDYRMMLEKGREIIVGVRLLMKALEAPKAMIGIEDNKPEAIANLTALSKNYPDIAVVPLKTKYPQGGEKQLIKALTGREVPSGKIPLDVGAVPFNVGTAFAVYEAVQKNKPLIERTLTIAYKNAQHTQNIKVRIGTNLADVVEMAGGVPNDASKIIFGGPMMGKAAVSLSVPMTKGCSGIVFLDENQAERMNPTPCIRCAKCVSACPMGLEPYLLSKLSSMSMLDRAEQENITLCIECGSCSFICPANRPLLDWIRVAKAAVIRKAKLSKK